jgi:hypothetical protein
MIVSRGDSAIPEAAFANGEVFGASPVAANGDVFVSDTPRRLLSSIRCLLSTTAVIWVLALEFGHTHGESEVRRTERVEASTDPQT